MWDLCCSIWDFLVACGIFNCTMWDCCCSMWGSFNCGRQALLLGRDGDCPHGWGARPPEPASRPPLLEGHGTSTGLEGHALDSRGSAQVAAALAARRGRPPTPLTPPHSDTAVWCLSNLETFSDFKTLFIHRGYESLSLLIKLFLLTFLN